MRAFASGASVAIAVVALAWSARAAAAQNVPSKQAPDAIAATLDSLSRDPNGLTVARGDVRSGAQTVAAGQTVAGSLGAWHGALDVRGTVKGNAVAIGGDVVIHSGGTVLGDAVSVGGTVHNEGGKVGGEMRSLSALTVGPVATGTHRTPAQQTKRSVSLSVGWFLVLAVIGLFVILFARNSLENIAERIRDDFSRSFLYGVAGQVAALPVLVAGIVVLAITVVGILLIPFAIVAFILAVAGALALGFVAMSYATGEAAMRWRGAVSPYAPAPALQFLLVGLSFYFVLWVLGGAFVWAGWLGAALRLVAAVVTWVALTVGFGATVASRGGTRAPTSTPPQVPPPPTTDYEWQTPTPVSGVAAARRPTPPPRQSVP